MSELDLTPQPAEPVPTARRSWRNWLIMGGLCLVGIFVLYQALTSARVFFYNVDEAVANRAELGESTFQMQGTVVDEPDVSADGSLLFTVSFGGQDAQVRHVGDEPSDLFKEGEQVVTRGHWQGETFESNQVVVKHSETYVEDNPNRVDYELDETAPEAG